MNITRMSYPQYRKARRLTHECCNYCNGNCLLLDDGEECVCVQSISYSLLCRWFKVAVLPLDAALCAEITKGRGEIKRCAVCGAAFTPKLVLIMLCCKKRNAGRRGFDSPRARRFAYSSVKWNRCAAKSASLMASSLSAVWQASAAISLSMSGKAARRFAAVLRRSVL